MKEDVIYVLSKHLGNKDFQDVSNELVSLFDQESVRVWNRAIQAASESAKTTIYRRNIGIYGKDIFVVDRSSILKLKVNGNRSNIK